MKPLTLLILLLLLIYGCHQENQNFDASGIFEANEIIISAEAYGKILDLNIREGQQLKAGQQLGQIKCTGIALQKEQLESGINALRQKQADPNPQVKVFRKQLNTQKKQVATLQTQLDVLEKERIRMQNLVNAKAAPSKKLDDITGNMEVLQKQKELAESRLNVIEQQIRSQQKSIAIQNRGILSEQEPIKKQIAQVEEQLNNCIIKNPISGTVLLQYTEANEFATPGKPLYKIAALDTLALRIYVSGSQLTQIQLNQPVKVIVDQGAEDSREIPGKIIWISDKAEFTPKTIQTKEERTNLVYAVKVEVKNDGFLKIGMYAEVLFDNDNSNHE